MNAVTVSTLVPGLLVSLKTSIRGGVAYQKQDLENTPEHAKWITDRTISDPEEHERATKVRNRCSSLVRGVCSLSTFGLLCRQDNQWKLEDAMAEAHALAATFNATSRFSKISVNVIVGRVADNDVEATRAIRAEVSDLIADMQSGISALDVEKVRDAANRAKSVGKMLSVSAQNDINAAIEAARSIARKIVKAGETAATEIDKETLAALARARTEFLDIPEEGAAPVHVEPVPVDGEARGVDLDPANGFPAEPGPGESDSYEPQPLPGTPAIDWDEPSDGSQVKGGA